jgi:hypothetical protein
MAMDAKQKEAERLITEFAIRLLALNDGKAIPRHWKNQLLKAIKPLPATRGRKRDYDQVVKAVKLLALSAGQVRRPLTMHHNPAVFKDQIATAVGVARKTIERIDEARPEYMRELARLDELSPELRKAYIDGISAAICEKRREGDAIERKAKENEMRRRFPSGK